MVRHTGNKWRPVIKNIGVTSRSLLYRLFESLMVLPLLNEIFLVFLEFAPSTLFELHHFLLIVDFLSEHKKYFFRILESFHDVVIDGTIQFPKEVFLWRLVVLL